MLPAQLPGQEHRPRIVSALRRGQRRCYARVTQRKCARIGQTMEPGRATMSESTTLFSDTLRRLRSAAALSQEELAERAGLSERGISDLERGARLVPRLETVRMVADALALGDADRTSLLVAARPGLLGNGHTAPDPMSPRSLPTPLTRLIGREAELAALRALLCDGDVRVVTL